MNVVNTKKFTDDLKVLKDDAGELIKTAVNEGRAKIHDLCRAVDRIHQDRRARPEKARWFERRHQVDATRLIKPSGIAWLSAGVVIGAAALLAAGQYRR